jgi:glycosyltransferase involved in cell wall biosynthesis
LDKDLIFEMQGLSLVIPLKNESSSIEALIQSIRNQSYQPAEIILVDGGSTDNTVKLLKQLTMDDPRFRIIEVEQAMPGKGRNIGTENAIHPWIAYTDAGIKLDKYWLENLVKKAEENPGSAIIYGNYTPQINSWFDKCLVIGYVPGVKPGKIRDKFIASSLFKKEVWEKTGGFPDWRAVEDNAFMKKAEQLGYDPSFAPEAMVYWQANPDLISTFRKFELYSMHNVWAGWQADWHYGIARQYIIMLIAVLLGIFHSPWWLLLPPLWIGLRTAKRIYSFRHEYGLGILFNPLIFFGVLVTSLVIDAATFSGWIKALIQKKAVS